MATEYLIFSGIWHIARPGVITDDTDDCSACGGTNRACIECKGSGRVKVATEDRPLRLAWIGREGGFICFDYNRPEVKALD